MGWRTWTAAAVTVGAAAGALVRADPGWVRAAGLDVWNLPAAAADLDASDARRDELAEFEDRLAARWVASDRVAEAVRAGRLSAADGAAELDRLVAADAGWYRSLLAQCRVFLGREPAGRPEVVAWYLANKLKALAILAGERPPD